MTNRPPQLTPVGDKPIRVVTGPNASIGRVSGAADPTARSRWALLLKSHSALLPTPNSPLTIPHSPLLTAHYFASEITAADSIFVSRVTSL